MHWMVPPRVHEVISITKIYQRVPRLHRDNKRMPGFGAARRFVCLDKVIIVTHIFIMLISPNIFRNMLNRKMLFEIGRTRLKRGVFGGIEPRLLQGR